MAAETSKEKADPIMRRVTVEYQGRLYEGEDLEWSQSQGEIWSEYRVADGAVVHVKYVVSKICRLLDQHTQFGEPIYVVYGTSLVRANVPAHLAPPSGTLPRARWEEKGE